MPRMSIAMPPEQVIQRPPLKPFLLLTLSLAVLAFCTTLLAR
jgi:hypothetical protein